MSRTYRVPILEKLLREESREIPLVWKRVRSHIGFRCVYCHELIDIHCHQTTLEFVNGYPAACRMIGRSAFQERDLATQWIESAFDEWMDWVGDELL